MSACVSIYFVDLILSGNAVISDIQTILFWCVFEMAAFAKKLIEIEEIETAKAEGTQTARFAAWFRRSFVASAIEIVPIVMGPVVVVNMACCAAFWILFIVLKASWGFAAFLLYVSACGSVHFARGYARTIEELWSQLSSFTAEEASPLPERPDPMFDHV